VCAGVHRAFRRRLSKVSAAGRSVKAAARPS